MANSNAGTSGGNAGGGKYQVFLNFCGGDTRSGFTDFLYEELVENGIHVFMDDEELPVGEEIDRELPQAIDDSQIYVPIFSPNYASRKWCLRELVRMVDNQFKSKKEKKILPIFYDVEPKDVALKPTSLYITAIEEHKRNFPKEGESWEGALQKIDEIKGWELAKCKSKAVLMKLAVQKVLRQLKRKSKTLTEDLVGLDGPVREVLKRLDVNCSDVRLFVIYGMGGIGKTTLAKSIYNELHSRFEKCCAFLADVRETSKEEGLLKLQKNLLTEIVSFKAAEIIYDVDYGRKRIEDTLGRNKDSEKVPGNDETPGFLIVLDDVDEKEQIENLIGQRSLQPRTRVIITTRNTSVLEFVEQRMAREMKEMNSDHALPIPYFEMKEMNFDHALQLFKRHAFLEGSLANDFDSLSKDIVSTTGGLPLALRVVGSLLCGKPKAKWEKTLKQLMKIPHKDVQKTLMISYKDLNYRQREIFLDIACFFINEDMKNANYMWEACEFYPNVEIDVLVEMSLINMKDNKFWMHDQLRDLGREIVCQESPTILGRQSRLWNNEEVLDLVKTKLRKKKVEAIDLWGSSHISIKNEEIERFESLRFLRLSNGTLHGDFTDCLPMLKWISWSSPLPDCSVVNMHLKNLVVLEFFDNHFTDDSKVWDSLKMATKLKSLALVKCHCITRTPDLSKCLALERLTFDDCGRLTVIDSSIALLELQPHRLQNQEIQLDGLLQLQYLMLGFCDLKSLSVPSSLRTLSVYQCHNLIEIQFLGTSALLEELRIEFCKSIGRMVLCGEVGSLGFLNQSESSSRESTYCSPGVVIPNALKKLRKLRLKWCENIREIQVIGALFSLQDIYIERCIAMETLSGVSNLKNLESLYIYDSPRLRLVEGLDELTSLTKLEVFHCPSLETLLDRSNSKVGEMCLIKVSRCRESLNSSPEGYITFERYKRMAQQGAPQPETNKEEAKMEGDAVEPDTEPQSPSHSSTSSSDHEISEEPPVDNVRDGTLPEK